MSERLSHGAPTFFVREKRSFLMVLTDHHGDGRFAIWCAAGDGVQQMLVEADPERFFVPPYVGYRGWLGMRLDRGLDWDELAGLPRTRTPRWRRRSCRSSRSKTTSSYVSVSLPRTAFALTVHEACHSSILAARRAAGPDESLLVELGDRANAGGDAGELDLKRRSLDAGRGGAQEVYPHKRPS